MLTLSTSERDCTWRWNVKEAIKLKRYHNKKEIWAQSHAEGRLGEDSWRRQTIYNPRTQTSERTGPADTLTLDFWPLQLWENTFLLFKSWSPWYLVTAALAYWGTHHHGINGSDHVLWVAVCQAWCQDRATCHHSYSSLTREGTDQGPLWEQPGSATYQQCDLK